MNNRISLLKKQPLRFSRNTDANSTFRGFHYQAIKTVEEWISLYLSGNNFNIYCETEDDIKIEKAQNIIFQQIKCYSKQRLSLSSVEIKKSILNFFILFHKYRNKNTEFIFISSGNHVKKNNLFKEWINNLKTQNYDFQPITLLIKDTMSEYLARKRKKELTIIDNSKANQTKKKLDKAQKNAEYDELESKINDKSFEDFIKSIKWEFKQNSDSEKEVLNTLKELKNGILKIKEFQNIPELATARLLTEVYNKSSANEIEERKLNTHLLNNIIKESNYELNKYSKEYYKNIMEKRFDKIEKRLEDIKDTVDENASNQKKEDIRKRIHLFERLVFEENDIRKEEPILMLISLEDLRKGIQKFGTESLGDKELEATLQELKAKLKEIRDRVFDKYPNMFNAIKYKNSYNFNVFQELTQKHPKEFDDCLNYLFKAREDIYTFKRILSQRLNKIK